MAKTHDSLGRRIRFINTPSGASHKGADGDIEIYYAALKHGPLPTEFFPGLLPHRWPKSVKERLSVLATDLNRLNRYQVKSFNAFGSQLIYELNVDSASVLDGRGMYSEYAPRKHPPIEHALMVSTITASAEIETLQHKTYDFIPQHKVINKPLEVQLERKLAPDGLFGLAIDGDMLNCFVEADRSTEPNYSKATRKSIESMVIAYKHLIGRKIYKEHFGMEGGALLMFATTTETKKRAFLEIVKEHFPNGCTYMLAAVFPDFGSDYKIPKPFPVLTRAWSRYAHDDYILIKPQ
jgi:hypothetical protein